MSDDRFCVTTHGVTSRGGVGAAASLLWNHDKASEKDKGLRISAAVVTASPVSVDGPVQVLHAGAELLGVVPDPQQDGHGLVPVPRGQVSLAPKQPGPGLAASK